jgi:hypothetical protein
MEPKTKKRIIIGVASLAILGIATYFGVKWWKNKQKEKEEAAKRKAEEEATKNEIKATQSGSAPAPSYTFPFKTVEEGNAFRKWVNKNYPDWAKKEKLAESGQLNSWVEKAWKQYGTEYTQKILNAPVEVKTDLNPGDKVVAKNKTKGYSTTTKAKPYNKGGAGSGWIPKGYEAGTIAEISTKWNSALVANNVYPMVDEKGTKVFRYWVTLSDLEKL